MTKKDFQLIAATVAAMPFDGAKYQTANEVRLVVASRFADALSRTNPLFKRELFIQAATGIVAVTARKPKRDCPCGSLRDGFHNANCADRSLGIGNPEGLPSGPVARTLASDLAEDR